VGTVKGSSSSARQAVADRRWGREISVPQLVGNGSGKCFLGIIFRKAYNSKTCDWSNHGIGQTIREISNSRQAALRILGEGCCRIRNAVQEKQAAESKPGGGRILVNPEVHPSTSRTDSRQTHAHTNLCSLQPRTTHSFFCPSCSSAALLAYRVEDAHPHIRSRERENGRANLT
jgi:hypothetical protein